MIRILGTILAALAGLAFGSFLNVCVTRWPAGRKHRYATLALPCLQPYADVVGKRATGQLARAARSMQDVSRSVQLALSAGGTGRGGVVGRSLASGFGRALLTSPHSLDPLLTVIDLMILLWLLVALAVLDAEHLWLPNKITFPGILLGLAFTTAHELLGYHFDAKAEPWRALLGGIVAALIASGIVLLIRWIYWLVRRQEGIGMGDAKLMAMLGAWLGLPGALLAFVIGVVLGAGFRADCTGVSPSWV